MEFSEFADRAAAVEAASADTEITHLVADLFEAADDDLSIVARYVQGRVLPGHDETTLNVGPNNCYAAIARAAGQNVDADDVEATVADLGDVGDVAAAYDFGTQRGLSAFGTGDEESLTVGGVHAELETLANASGPGSTDEKVTILFGLFNRCSSTEARYLARLVLSEMRIGVGAGTVRDAIIEAFDVSAEAVERALQVSNDYGLVAETARDDPDRLDEISLEIGRPVQAMLAQAGTAGDALSAWGETVVETKYDGARVQIHVDDGVDIYSRNMEDVTDPLPDVVETVEEAIDVPAILDGEVLAIDESGDPLPFQEVLRRFRRKHDIEQASAAVDLDLVVFDCLHADGDDLIDEPLCDRRDRLERIWDGHLADFSLAAEPETIARLEDEALDAGHEGIMLKDPDSAYTPGRRGKNWLKRKPDVETLDLVVTGAEWGEGRRASFLGSYELSVHTPNGFETVGKVATGITDEELKRLSALVEPKIRSEDGRTVDVEPSVVFEVGYEEIQHSPTYSSGYALRFPRFIGVREDLNAEDADTLDRVERLVDA
ncbi:ATP-dependent DNA ligase LigA [Halanaeroarchaeum sulfurireducens]|uniref:DNA ligase n=1 Tax=Halanaeroarchaeum sulfurireducens TaxID=1604004 RepID=A0A0F7PF81_9EURY|nr:ATP-dependent DNA ligase LigA [Halanaeroarchaeum sulfurireducens]AKH97983.1 ATP-dependent DNA ligase [Halanaeroarchaeum sulfurireducens]